MTELNRKKYRAVLSDLARYRKGLILTDSAHVSQLRIKLFELERLERTELPSKEPSPSQGKTIKLHPSDFDKGGNRSIWRIYPTQRMRSLAIKAFKGKYPELNYFVGWKDSAGWGLHCAVSTWLRRGETYYNIH